MMSTLIYRLWRLSRRIWIRTTLISLLAVVAAVLSPVISPLLPPKIAVSIDAAAVRQLLNVLSDSMLAITTFSLSVIAATHLTAANSVTPRVHRLLREDGRMQTTLATFMGAFVYALVSLVLLNLRIHDKSDFGTVYIFTLLVIALVIIAILRWIQHLVGLGAMDATTERVEAQTRAALERFEADPFFGGTPVDDVLPHPAAGPVPGPDAEAPPPGGFPLPAPRYGHVQTIDVEALGKLQKRLGGRVRLAVMPGDWVDRGAPLAWLIGLMSDAPTAEAQSAFVLGTARTFAADPAYGFQVLSEIASRALSPGVNDPRTADDVLLRMLQLLDRPVPEPGEVTRPWLDVPTRDTGRFVSIAIDPVARDGAAMIELAERVQRVLAALARHGDPGVAAAARFSAARALALAERALPLDADKARLRAISPA